MSWNKVVSRAFSKWMESSGTASDIVLSSRVRLARNVEGLPFPHMLSDEQANQIVSAVAAGVHEINLMGLGTKVELFPLAEFPPLDRQALVEKHLISPQQAQEDRGKAVVISDDESVSIMVNEEDHLRIQCLFPGLQLEEAWGLASKVDDALEQKLIFAFHQQRGYLTACPTNLGTGLRASVMMHLPALVMSNLAGRVFSTLSQVGLVVRGLYGEGTEAIGNIFQVSNQTALGPTEEEIIQNLNAVTLKIIEHERRARESLRREMKEHLEDQIGRALGLLSHAHIISSDEAMRLLSKVRLGIDMKLITGISPTTVNELLVATRPAFLQLLAKRELNSHERDVRRAALIRQKLVRSA